jgi:hypothetical protein
VVIVPAERTAEVHRRRRWGGLGPYCIKLEEENTVEEAVAPPARVLTPVCIIYLGTVVPPPLFLIIFPLGHLHSPDRERGQGRGQSFLSLLPGKITFLHGIFLGFSRILLESSLPVMIEFYKK